MSVLDYFVRMRLYRERASEFELLAETEDRSDVRLRYRIVASHYRELAEREEKADKARMAKRLEQLRLCWDVFRLFGSRRGDDTNRRTFQPRCYGRAHAGTECLVNGEMIGAMDFVVVAHWCISTKGPQGHAARGPAPARTVLSPLGGQHLKSVSWICGSFV